MVQMTDNTTDRIMKVISEKFNLDISKLNLDSRFIEDLEADSLDIVEAIMALEEEFGCDIPDEQAEKMKTINDVKTFIESVSLKN